MPILFLTLGPTHSGKTTFGAKLRRALGESAKFIHVDNDVVDEFIKENFNNLRTDKEVVARRTPSDPDLRLLIPRLVSGYALREGYSVIATAAHPKHVIRQAYHDIARENSAQVVLLIFRISDGQVSQRIEHNNRDVAILDNSPHGGIDFLDLFNRQKDIIEEPTDEEKQRYFKVFEVTPDNADDILDAVINLTKET